MFFSQKHNLQKTQITRERSDKSWFNKKQQLLVKEKYEGIIDVWIWESKFLKEKKITVSHFLNIFNPGKTNLFFIESIWN